MLKKKYLILSLIILVGLWVSGYFWFCHKINHYGYQNEHTDAIVVLTGGRNRISEAIRLFNDKFADKMFISGVSNHVTIQNIEYETGINILFPNKVELGYKAQNTYGNAAEVKEWIEINGIRSIRLITSNYHMPRAMAELKVYRLPLKIIAHPVYSEKISDKWWISKKTFVFILAEYNKFLLAYFRSFLNL